MVDGDLGLSGGDLRAAERQFQLLYQVAGRAGRGRPGRVLIQTHLPEHPVMQAIASGDKERFYAEELAERRAAGLPPFGRLAALIVAGRDPGATRAFAAALARSAPDLPGLRVLGPAPAPIALLRGRNRQRLLVIAAPRSICPRLSRPGSRDASRPGACACRSTSTPTAFFNLLFYRYAHLTNWILGLSSYHPQLTEMIVAGFSDFFKGLLGAVGNGRENRDDDVKQVKRGLGSGVLG